MPITKFLFWNINRRPLAGLVAELAEIHRVDVVILAECDTDPAIILDALNRTTGTDFRIPVSFCERIVTFTRFSTEFLRPEFENERVSIRRLVLPDRLPVLLAAVHLLSKRSWSGESQGFECVELADRIEIEEKKAGHSRTILVGDFNMNPFESGLVSSIGLNSVMSRQVASRGTRTVQGREYPFFYNPMWSHFGDARSATAGSYFYDASQHVSYYWNIFDQVMLRPELADRFHPSQLSIVRAIGRLSLVRPNGRPDKQKGSDHLPLVF